MMLISFAYALVLGFAIGLPGFSFAIVQHYLFLILIIGALHLLLSAPLALLACISRGYLVPIGFAFTTLMLALVFGPTAIGKYPPGLYLLCICRKTASHHFPWQKPVIF